MRLTVLFMLAAFAIAHPYPTDAFAAAAVQDARPIQTFQMTPLQLGPGPIAPFQLGLPGQAAPSLMASPPVRETQLTNRRTGVTCTMRVIRAGASMDPGILGGMFQGPQGPDPIVRNDVAPCVE